MNTNTKNTENKKTGRIPDTKGDTSATYAVDPLVIDTATGMVMRRSEFLEDRRCR